MALSTYSDLKTAVASWLNRTDLTSVIPDFVVLAESDIRNDIRLPAMETLASGTLSGNTLAQPTRYLSTRRLVVKGDVYAYVTPDRFQELDQASATEPSYTIVGQTFYMVNAKDGDAYSLLYYQGFAALSGASDTNWLLSNAPDVYLFAACKHAATYLKSPEEEARFVALYQSAMQRVQRVEYRSNYSNTLTVRAA